MVGDALLHHRLATRDQLERWSTPAPQRVRTLLDRLDDAESGLESIVRLRLRALGVTVRAQVWIGTRRVDLLVGERLVVECDGAEHHGVWQAHEADRARDRALTALGFVVVRLTYRQILDDWPVVEQDLLAIIRRGEHRAPRRRDHA
ncbi:endonuclease domain-containing protein [Agrococcus versicolor]|uniref:endonuclease domain-containing protein n=1 Tax=Agrococcus versicolor TaxID=501482 RepID=UPI0031E10C46